MVWQREGGKEKARRVHIQSGNGSAYSAAIKGFSSLRIGLVVAMIDGDARCAG